MEQITFRERMLAHLEYRRGAIEMTLKNVKSSQRALMKMAEPETYDFDIHLYSYWASEGEHNVSGRYANATLAGAVEAACTRFKQINQRSDVQAEVHAYLVLKNQILPIPKDEVESHVR